MGRALTTIAALAAALLLLAACSSESQTTAEPQIAEVTRIVTVEAPARNREITRLDIVKKRGKLVWPAAGRQRASVSWTRTPAEFRALT